MTTPETSPGEDASPNPIQTEENASVFEKVMNDIESNDDIDEQIIQKATGAKDVVPDEDTSTSSEADKAVEEAAEGEQAADQGEVPAEEADAEPTEGDQMERFRKIAKRGRQVGNREHQINQREAQHQRRSAESEAREQSYADRLQHLEAREAAFEADPIDAYKQRGADPKKLGGRIKQLLQNPGAVQTNDDVTALRSELKEVRDSLSARDKREEDARARRTLGEAEDEGFNNLVAYMSDDSAKKAFPLASKVPKSHFRQYAEGAATSLQNARIPVTFDSVLDTIEASLEAMRSVYGDGPPPTTEKRAEPAASTPNGQRSAPSIGNAERASSSGGGIDWDTMSIGDDDDDFVNAIKRDIAASG